MVLRPLLQVLGPHIAAAPAGAVVTPTTTEADATEEMTTANTTRRRKPLKILRIQLTKQLGASVVAMTATQPPTQRTRLQKAQPTPPKKQRTTLRLL